MQPFLLASSDVPTSSIAKFLSNSHPIAPAPTMSNFISFIFFRTSFPTIERSPSVRFFFKLKLSEVTESSRLDISIEGRTSGVQ